MNSENRQVGRLLGIAIRKKSRAEMIVSTAIDVTTQSGLDDDFRGKSRKRQVTVLSTEAWQEACDAIGKPLPWTTRRANLLVSGLDLLETTGAIIQLGDVQLEVTGQTDPCERMDEYSAGLQTALLPDWRGGVCCRVIAAGRLQEGQDVTLSQSCS